MTHNLNSLNLIQVIIMNTDFIIIVSIVSLIIAVLVMYKVRENVDRLAEERRLENRDQYLQAGEEEPDEIV